MTIATMNTRLLQRNTIITITRTRYFGNRMCVAVIVYGIGAVFVVAIVVGVVLIAVGVIKIFVGLVIVPMNCNNPKRFCRRRMCCYNSCVPNCNSPVRCCNSR